MQHTDYFEAEKVASDLNILQTHLGCLFCTAIVVFGFLFLFSALKLLIFNMLDSNKVNGSTRMDGFCFLLTASIEVLFKKF